MICLSLALATLSQDTSQGVVTSINNFGLSTISKLSSSNGKSNVMISSWSLQECVGMLRLGARGKTDEELKKFLQQKGTATQTGTSLKLIRGRISKLIENDTIRQANGIWVRTGFDINPQFSKDVKNLFSAMAVETSFPNPGLGQVNMFVSDTTRGQIPKLFENLNGGTEMVLVNAVSFLDKWKIPFDKNQTQNLPFTTGQGTKKQVPTMQANGRQLYGETGEAQFLSLPYKSGLRMTVILPKKGNSLSKILASPKLMETMTNLSSSRPGKVFLPKWKSEFTWDLKSWMQKQGVKTFFNSSADLSGLNRSGGLQVSEAIQKTFIRVDEEGTEAAAATGIVTTKGIMRPEDNFTFRADHPFAYMIYSPGGPVFFTGTVNDPTK